ncbi:MAG: hypothetical protein QOI41_6147 [Myxococcales bacterium]|nr:hypothetical protein [Myxococcales bacterium]
MTGEAAGKTKKGIVYLVSLIGVSNTRRPFFPAEIDWARRQAQPDTLDDVPRPDPGFVALAVLASVLAGGVGVVACGSSDHPVSFADAVAADGGAASDTDGSASEPDGGLSCVGDGGGALPANCACKYAYSPSIIITLQCGLSLCSQGKDERADCSLDGMLTIVPHAGKTCPTDGSGVPDGGTAEIEGTNGDGGTHTTIPCASR